MSSVNQRGHAVINAATPKRKELDWVTSSTSFGLHRLERVSSAITGIVFRASVSDSGVHPFACIMVGVSLLLLLISVLDHTLRSRTGSE